MDYSEVGIRKALVTGGTRGIGYAIAEMLVRNGIEVCISGTNSETVNRAAQKLGAAIAIAVDLEQPDAPNVLISQAVKALGGLDLVVNNAGISLQASLEETSISACKSSLLHL